MNEAKYRQAETRLWNRYDLEPTERFVRLAGTGTRVRVLEVGTGDPALFIHGGPSAGSAWAPLLEHLEGFRCLLVDRPGTGLSEPYPVRAANLLDFGARFVGDLLDALGLERAHVVASSFGGHLALRSAARDPSRFVRMVQMACPALVPGETLPPFMGSIANPLMRRLAALLPPNPRMDASILRQLGHGASLDAGRIPAAFTAWYADLQRFTDTRRHDFALIASVIADRDAVTLTEATFAAAEVPTLFLWGADDTFGDERVARHIVTAMPDAELHTIPGAGHLPWIDFPAELARSTAVFLSPGVPVPAPADLREGVRP